MYCSKCGSEVGDNTKFCGECGAAVQPHESEAAPTAANAAPAENIGEHAAASDSPSAANGDKPKNGKKIVIAIVAIVAVIAIVCGCVFAYLQHKAYEEAHEPVIISLGFSYVTVDGAEASAEAIPIGVPVSITGTDLDGNAVHEQFLATPASEERELLQGDYEFTVIGDPITTGGTVYTCDDETATRTTTVNVDRNGESSIVTGTDIDFEFVPLPVTEVTDEVLAEIRAWMEELDVSTEETDTAIKAATDLREAELARIAEEEERARQEAERQRLEEEKQAALAANPTYIGGTSEMNHSQTAQLTGTVRRVYSEGMIETEKGYVYYLELPSPVTFDGSQYGPQTTSKVISLFGFENHVDQVITISAYYSVRVTASIKEAPISTVYAVSPTIVRVW